MENVSAADQSMDLTSSHFAWSCWGLQENVQLVKSERGIKHRAIDSYFGSFNQHLDR